MGGGEVEGGGVEEGWGGEGDVERVLDSSSAI